MFFFSLLLSLAAQGMCQMDYTGHKLLSLMPKNENEVKFMKILVKDENIDVWNSAPVPGEATKILVSPEDENFVAKTLKSKGIEFRVVTDNLQKLIDKEREENSFDVAREERQEDFRFDVYHPLEEINAYLDSVASRYNGLAEIQDIGRTFQRRPLRGLKIGSPGDGKPVIFIDAGIHAREWVAPATALYFIDQLVKGYDTDSEIRQYLDTYDWYIYPVVNPDGYKYTWTNDRLWRKNRSPNFRLLKPVCPGADLNRNFAVGFGGANTSSNPCNDYYPGSKAFSEAESRAIRDTVFKFGDKLKLYMSYHSFSQLYMSPYGYTKQLPPDYNDHIRALEAGVNAVKNVSGEDYKFGPIATTVYEEGGSSVDWIYVKAKIKYSFTVELRDKGETGFLLPRELILPTAEENFAGFRALLDTINSEISQ